MSMHEKLKKYFEGKGITQQQIADVLGVSLPYVNAVLNGTKMLGKKNAVKWANLFGLSKSFLLTGEGEIVSDGRQQQIANRANEIQKAVIGHVVEPHNVREGMAADDPRPTLPTWADTLLEILSKQIAENEVLHAELKRSITDMNQSMNEVREMKEQLSLLIKQIR